MEDITDDDDLAEERRDRLCPECGNDTADKDEPKCKACCGYVFRGDPIRGIEI